MRGKLSRKAFALLMSAMMMVSFMPALSFADTTDAASTEVKSLLMLTGTAKSGKQVVKWTEVSDAEGYDVFFAKSGSTMKKVKTVKASRKLSFTKKKLNNKKVYKWKVKAFNTVDGEKKYVVSSPTIHIAGKSNKNSNATAVKLSQKSAEMMVDETLKLVAKISAKSSKKTVLSKGHAAAIRYYSSNKAVAKVSSTGTITATGKGECYVYAVAPSGVYAKAKVAVEGKNQQKVDSTPVPAAGCGHKYHITSDGSWHCNNCGKLLPGTDTAYITLLDSDRQPKKIYPLTAEGNFTDTTLATGVSVSKNVDSISYNNTASGDAQEVVIRTNSASTSLTINAAADTVKHYGAVGSLNIIAVANMSYHEYGQVAFAEIATGRIVLESESEVEHVHLTATGGNFNDITVAKASDVEMPEFSRDPVDIPAEGKLVVALQKGTKQDDNKEYVWLTAVGIYEQVTVSDSKDDAKNNYAATSTTASQEQKTAAQQIANNITFEVGGEDYKVSAKTTDGGATWTYEVVDQNGTVSEGYSATKHSTENTVNVQTTGENPGAVATTKENGLSEAAKEEVKEAAIEEAIEEAVAKKQATCDHEFNEAYVCVKCGLKQAPTDAKLVEQGYVVRVVGGDGYMSLQEGMLALSENDTLKVLQDISLTSQTTSGLSAKKCTIDLNGKTITASGTWKLSNTQYEYMPYEDYLDLGWDTPSKEEYEADPYPLRMNENPVDVTIMNGTYIVNGTDSGRIRFEHGSTGHFENVIIKSSKETTTYQGLQTVAYNLSGAIDNNTYYFTDCSFENVYLGFEGKSGSCNKYDISFEKCNFNSVTSSNGYNQIKFTDYNYGDLSINNCTFNLTGNAGGGAAYCFQIGTYLSYTSGKILNVTLIDSKFNVNNNAGIYSNRFLPYNSNYMDNSSITVSNTTFTKDGKTVEPAIKEQTPTNKSLVWVANADAFVACYAEWLNYAKASPACASYNSFNYYLVECDGYYFVMGQGQQYATNAVITMEGDTVVKVLTDTSYGTTYNKIGETDISLELGESDNVNVHIYALSK